MSQQQQNNTLNSQARQVASYPSPHSYPSPSMSAYAYPPPTSGQSVEPYRASPTGSHVSLPSLNLPPLRNMDNRSPSHQQQQQPSSATPQPQQQPSGQHAMGSPLPPPMAQYYHNPQQSLPPPPHNMNVTSDPNQPLRYPLPAQDGRMMSGGRHKKEIKRRTKTGCLTCRKRRIKCDEAHPTCRNCIKSKRECLGYDPIFKSQPGPAAIQPAPSSGPTMQNQQVNPSPYPPPPQGYMPAVTQPYGPSLTAGVNSPGSSAEPYDYSNAIDPALEGAGTSQMQVPLSSYDGADQIRQGAKPTRIEDLLHVNGFQPPPADTPTTIPPSTFEEMKVLYSTVYAPAVDKFLETRWFTTRGISHFVHDTKLCQQYMHLIQKFSVPAGNFNAGFVVQSLEASVIWQTMCLCRGVSAAVNNSTTNGQAEYNIEVNEGVHDAAQRLEVFEKLVTNVYLEGEPLSQPAPSTGRNNSMLDDQLKYREREFWRLVSVFLTLHDDEASTAKEIDNTLTECRRLLDSRENRDVIYSIAIARHISQRMAEASGRATDSADGKENTVEKDEQDKYRVAQQFLSDQARGRGTTQVIQRVCGMAMNSLGFSPL